MCVNYMYQVVQSKLKVFQRTQGRMGTPLTRHMGSERKKYKRRVKVKLKSKGKRERKGRKGKRVGEGEEEQHRIRRLGVNESSARRATEKIRWREKGNNLEESKEENEWR